MPSDIQVGKGTIWGIGNSGSAITMTGYATFLMQGAKLAHKFKLGEVQDEGGNDAQLSATNEHQEVEIEWKPSGATRATAVATAALIAPLAKVTLANFKVAAYNGDYVYIGDETIDMKNTENASMTLKLRKYADGTQNTSLTTTVSG